MQHDIISLRSCLQPARALRRRRRTYRVGGVVELAQRFLTPEERAELFAQKEPRVDAPTRPKIGRELEARLASGEADELIPGVLVAVRRPAQMDGTATDAIQRAIAEGLIATVGDREQIRAEVLAERRALYLEAMQPILDVLADRGRHPTLSCDQKVLAVLATRQADK